MNKQQTEQASQVVRSMSEAISALEEILEQLQTELDARSEKWQKGEKGQALAEMIDHITGAMDHCEEVISSLANIEGVDL